MRGVRDPDPTCTNVAFIVTLTSPPSFSPFLPAYRSDIYYRDNIGNVSTSSLKYNLDGVELSVLSRFPMFGGWKNAWYQGYNLPTEVSVFDGDAPPAKEVTCRPGRTKCWGFLQ